MAAGVAVELVAAAACASASAAAGLVAATGAGELKPTFDVVLTGTERMVEPVGVVGLPVDVVVATGVVTGTGVGSGGVPTLPELLIVAPMDAVALAACNDVAAKPIVPATTPAAHTTPTVSKGNLFNCTPSVQKP